MSIHGLRLIVLAVYLKSSPNFSDFLRFVASVSCPVCHLVCSLAAIAHLLQGSTYFSFSNALLLSMSYCCLPVKVFLPRELYSDLPIWHQQPKLHKSPFVPRLDAQFEQHVSFLCVSSFFRLFKAFYLDFTVISCW